LALKNDNDCEPRPFLPDLVREIVILVSRYITFHADPFPLLLYSAALDEQQRKEAKSQNENGNPIKLQSKILAVFSDPWNQGSVYVAQSSGVVRRVVLAVYN
jgi:hypothetical protein